MSTATDIRHIPLSQLRVSTTGAQEERRKHYDKTAITELAESIKTVGLLQPIVAVPFNSTDANTGEDRYAIIAGERRFLAAKQAGLSEILVSVRDLTDEQVIEVQLIENLQREGLHELAEAEGYEQLQKLGHSAEEIAAKVGRSRGYVYGRMKLLALCKEARTAFYDGRLNGSTALLLARKEITSEMYDGPMSYREAATHVQRKYMLRLDQAPFPTDDETLCRGAVACGRCPKNTLSQPGLFGDVKAGSAGVCTDPTCFKAKRESWAERQIEKAKAAGQKVITGADAKKIAGHGYITNGYSKLDETCWDDPKHRTYKQLLGKDAKPDLLKMPESGDLVAVVHKSAVLKQLKADGVIKPTKRRTGAKPDKTAAQSEAQHRIIDEQVENQLFRAVRDKDGGKVGTEHLSYVLAHLLATGDFNTEPLEESLGFSPQACYADNFKRLVKFKESQLHRLLIDVVYLADLEYVYSGNDFLRLTAKRLKIDEKKIRAELTPAPKEEPKAKAKKKGKRK